MSATKRRRLIACGVIVFAEFFERLAYYGLTGNLVMYFARRPLHWNAFNAAFVSLLAQGVCYFSSIFFGWLSDGFLSKFTLLTLSFGLYAALYSVFPLLFPYYVPYTGLPVHDPWQWGWLAPLSNYSNAFCYPFNYTGPPPVSNVTIGNLSLVGQPDDALYPHWSRMRHSFTMWSSLSPLHGVGSPALSREGATCRGLFSENCSLLLVPILILLMLCTGAIKATLVPFGYQQLREEPPEVTRSFLNWFYWMTNAGSFIAFTFVAYMQQAMNIFVGYAVPFVSISLAFVVFLIGRCWYYVENEASARKSLFTTVLAILWQACTRHRFMCCLYSLRRRRILRPLLIRRALIEQTLSGVQTAAAAATANGLHSNGGTHAHTHASSNGYASENEYLQEEYLPSASPLPPGSTAAGSTATGLYPELSAVDEELHSPSRRLFLPRSCLDLSKQRYGGSYTEEQVEEVKSLAGVLLVFLTWIPYWVVYFQMTTTFFMQALHMNLAPFVSLNQSEPFAIGPAIARPHPHPQPHPLSFPPHGDHRGFHGDWRPPSLVFPPPPSSDLQFPAGAGASGLLSSTSAAPDHYHPLFAFEIPAAALSVFDTVALLLFIPLMDRVVHPFVDRRWRGFLTLRKRMLIGQAFSCLAILAAAGVEFLRLRDYWGAPLRHRENTSQPLEPQNWVEQTFAGTHYMAAKMPVFWLIPQFFLVGVAELFTTIAGLEFACRRAPRKLAALVMGLYWCVAGIGSFAGSALLRLFDGVFFFSDGRTGTDLRDSTADINYRGLCPGRKDLLCETRLDYYYVVLAGIQLVGLLVFSLVAFRVIDVEASHKSEAPAAAEDEAALLRRDVGLDYDPQYCSPAGVGQVCHVNAAVTRVPRHSLPPNAC